MKNKIIISLWGLCALLAFASCEKIGEETLLPGANLSIKLNIAGPATTKTIGTGTVADLETESAITTLDICLVSTTSLSDASTVNIISSSDRTVSGQPIMAWKLKSASVYEVNAIVPETISGSYYLYVIANRPSWMTISEYGDICGTFTNTKANLSDCWAEDNFLMINKQDATTTSGDQAGVLITMPDPDDEKIEATVTIERLATKIVVNNNLSMEVAPLLTQVLCSGDLEYPGVPDVKGAIEAMSIEGYALFNCVNSFNLIQRWSAASSTGDTEQLLVSPSSDASTPYSMTDGYYDNNPASLSFSDLGTVLYCMENNSPYYDTPLVSDKGDATPGTKMKGRVTGLVFKARAGHIKSFSGEAIINEDIDVDDNDVPWVTKGGDSDDANEDISWTTFYQYKGDYYGDIPCLLKHNSALATALGTTEPSVDQLRGKGVKVYEEGYMYYNYWISDKNYTDNGKNYLSVMRNTFYDIKITAINSLGDEFPCGGSSYNSADPISVDVPKLTISMDIPDWTDKEGNYTIREVIQ